MQILQNLKFQENFYPEFEIIKPLKALFIFNLNEPKHLHQEAATDRE